MLIKLNPNKRPVPDALSNIFLKCTAGLSEPSSFICHQFLSFGSNHLSHLRLNLAKDCMSSITDRLSYNFIP